MEAAVYTKQTFHSYIKGQIYTCDIYFIKRKTKLRSGILSIMAETEQFVNLEREKFYFCLFGIL